MVFQALIKDAARALIAKIERITRGKWWLLILTLICLSAALFFSFPSYEKFFSEGRRISLLKEQIDGPIDFLKNHPEGNNLIYRLTVPLLAQALHLNHIGCFVFQFFIGILLYALIAFIIFALTNDKIIAFLFAFGTSQIYPGITSFVELRGMFDGVAIFFACVAMFRRNLFLMFACITISLWTDERAFFSCLYAILWWHLDQECTSKNRQALSGLMAILMYLAVRFWLGQHYGLKTAGLQLLEEGPYVLYAQFKMNYGFQFLRWLFAL